jgi:hypothetical protein
LASSASIPSLFLLNKKKDSQFDGLGDSNLTRVPPAYGGDVDIEKFGQRLPPLMTEQPRAGAS